MAMPAVHTCHLLKTYERKKYDKGILNCGTAEILQQVRMETIWLVKPLKLEQLVVSVP